MYKNYLLVTKDLTRFYSTKDELMHELKGIEDFNNDEINKKYNVEKIEVIFAGRINVEQVYDNDRKQLVFV